MQADQHASDGPSRTDIRGQLRPALVGLALLTVITGVIYPGVVTAIAQVLFPDEANGSIIEGDDGRQLGSELIGQPFDDPAYFWGRPSATGDYAYDGAASSGSNLGPLSNELTATVRARIDALRAADPDNTTPIPVDLVTASGSGLDPHISVAAAEYQIGRVARERGLDVKIVEGLVGEHTEGRTIGILGEPRVNVLELNLALDQLEPTT